MKKEELLELENFSNDEDRLRFLRARRRVKEIKGFYVHLLVYLAVNIFVIVAGLIKKEKVDFHFGSLPVLWGIVILIHAGTVFLPNFLLGKDWEERKISEFMEKDKKGL